jgi:hypothetical protein
MNVSQGFVGQARRGQASGDDDAKRVHVEFLEKGLDLSFSGFVGPAPDPSLAMST